jgi:hypothetical protein
MYTLPLIVTPKVLAPVWVSGGSFEASVCASSLEQPDNPKMDIVINNCKNKFFIIFVF